MKKYIKQELLYGLHAKNYYIITLLLVVLFGCILFLNYNSVTDTYKSYVKTESYYKDKGLDIQKDLAGTYKVEGDSNNGTVSNPILFYKETLSKYIYAASPRYTITQLIESSVLLFPLVFGILGLIVATNDYKYRTIKFKSVRMSKSTIAISKQLSIVSVTFIILVIALTVSYLIGCIMYSRIINIIPIEQFASGPVLAKSPLIIKFIFAYSIALIFAEIGYSIGILFKNVSVGIIAIVVYMFVLPNFGKFDFKNSIYYFQKKVFDFYGVISVQNPEKTSLLLSGLIIVFIPAILIITNIITLRKRSSFEG